MLRSQSARSLFSGRSGLCLALAGLLPLLGAGACSSDSSSTGDGAVTPTGDGGVTTTGDAGNKTGDALGTSSLWTPDTGPGPIVGACEMQMAYLSVRTADGKATIASAMPTGCTLAMDSCVPGQAGDGGAATACKQITLLAGTAGTCSVALTSTTGQHTTVSAMLMSKPSGVRCTNPDGTVVDVPSLSFTPGLVTASFGADGGM